MEPSALSPGHRCENDALGCCCCCSTMPHNLVTESDISKHHDDSHVALPGIIPPIQIQIRKPMKDLLIPLNKRACMLDYRAQPSDCSKDACPPATELAARAA